MAVVHVADVEACTFTAQTAGTKCRQRALVRQFCQRVGLFHELRQLRRAEELTNRGDDRADVHQRDRRHVIRFTDRHTFLDDALGAAQPDTQLILDQFANRLDAAVAEVVDVVRTSFAVVDHDHALDQLDDVGFRDGAGRAGNRPVKAQALVELVTTDALKVVSALVEQLAFEVFARIVECRRVARAHTAVELDQSRLCNCLVFLRLPDRFHLQRAAQVLMIRVIVHVSVQRQ